MEATDAFCEFCGNRTDSIAGNPGKWPLRFTLPDGTGVVRSFHVACVTERLFFRKPHFDDQIAKWRAEGKIR